MKTFFIVFLVLTLFLSASCKKTPGLIAKTNYISFIVNEKDTLRFDSTYILSGVYNLWANTFYASEPINDFTCIMSDTLQLPSIYINFPGKTNGLFSQKTGKTFMRYVDINGYSYSGLVGGYNIKVVGYGSVGAQIYGQFDAVLRQPDLKHTVHITSGAFSVPRKTDFPKIP
jgi:hypothetical protein